MTQTPTMLRRTFLLFLLSALSAASAVNSPASAADWINWRGPMQNGVSLETNLPDEFNPGPGGNVIWKAPYGGRAAPLVMAGRVYVLQGTGRGLQEGEQ